jgi:hypothetical protein
MSSTRSLGSIASRSNATITAALVLLGALLVLPIAASAVGVRGRIEFEGRFGIVPMARARVSLCKARTDHCLTYITGGDGMYYFDAVPGPHDLYVDGRLLDQFFIPNRPYFDIWPVLGN